MPKSTPPHFSQHSDLIDNKSDSFEEEDYYDNSSKRTIVWIIIGIAVIIAAGVSYYIYADNSQKEAAIEKARQDSIAAVEQLRQDSIEAARAEAERIEAFRRDSIKAMKDFEDALLKPSDVFTKNSYDPIKAQSQISSTLEQNGFTLIDKKSMHEEGEEGLHYYTAWIYRLEVDERYSPSKTFCEVTISPDAYYKKLKITYSSTDLAARFWNACSPYIYMNYQKYTSKREIYAFLTDWLGISVNNKTIEVYGCNG